MDVWNPQTFDKELCDTLTAHTNLIRDYYTEDHQLMEAYLRPGVDERLGENKYRGPFYDFVEDTLTPLMFKRRIRVWHYTRLIDGEVLEMYRELKPSTLASLKQRLNLLQNNGLLSSIEADTIYAKSVFHQQNAIRSDKLYTTDIPHPFNYHGVVPLLESWGGEAAYFWLSDPVIEEKLKSIGKSRIVEIETEIKDEYNAFSCANTVTQAWARQNEGVAVTVSGCDLKITNCLKTAQVMHIHTNGDESFRQVAVSYPDNCEILTAIEYE